MEPHSTNVPVSLTKAADLMDQLLLNCIELMFPVSSYRTRSRNKEMVHEVIDFQSQSISHDIARDVDIRLDISAALARLNELDQQIISLRFFVDCTLLEISKIIGMTESAVKNRLYRALNKLKKELKEWGDITIMSIKELISIVDKSEAPSKNASMNKVYHDLFEELKSNVERIITTYRHRHSQKIAIEIYPDLPTFQQAINELDAPNWFMGTYEDNKIKSYPHSTQALNIRINRYYGTL